MNRRSFLKNSALVSLPVSAQAGDADLSLAPGDSTMVLHVNMARFRSSTFFKTVVPHGEDSFGLQVDNFAAFSEPIKEKIIREVSDIPGSAD